MLVQTIIIIGGVAITAFVFYNIFKKKEKVEVEKKPIIFPPVDVTELPVDVEPTPEPTVEPTEVPVDVEPTPDPTVEPTPDPTVEPTPDPTDGPVLIEPTPAETNTIELPVEPDPEPTPEMPIKPVPANCQTAIFRPAPEKYMYFDCCGNVFEGEGYQPWEKRSPVTIDINKEFEGMDLIGEEGYQDC